MIFCYREKRRNYSERWVYLIQPWRTIPKKPVNNSHRCRRTQGHVNPKYYISRGMVIRKNMMKRKRLSNSQWLYM